MGRYALAALLVLSGFLWAGCGLPAPFYLSPPSATYNSDYTTGVFAIQMTDHTSEPEFRGYELYYKLYSDAAVASAESLSFGGPSKTVDDLLQHGFLTLCRGPGTLAQDTSAETRATPLLAIAIADRTSSIPITVTFDPRADGSTDFSYTSPSTLSVVTQEIDRHVDASTGRCKPFTFGDGNYAAADQDFAPISPPMQSGQTLYVAVYAVSYGLQDLSTPIFSYPVALGYLQLLSFSF